MSKIMKYNNNNMRSRHFFDQLLSPAQCGARSRREDTRSSGLSLHYPSTVWRCSYKPKFNDRTTSVSPQGFLHKYAHDLDLECLTTSRNLTNYEMSRLFSNVYDQKHTNNKTISLLQAIIQLRYTFLQEIIGKNNK